MIKPQLLLSTVIALSCVAGPLYSQTDEEEVAVETFTPPIGISLTGLRYPRIKQRQGQQGWVILNYMVGTTGKPYDIAVVNSTHEAFEKSAIEAAEKWQYQPAMLDGEPIDAGTTMMITFALSGKPGASGKFVKRYRQSIETLEQSDQVKADEQFTNIQKSPRNLYEEAYYQILKFQYLEKFGGSQSAKYAGLARARYLNNGTGFLPDKLLDVTLQIKLNLQLKLNKMSLARATAIDISKRDVSQDIKEGMSRVLEQIELLRTSEATFAVQGQFNNGTQTTHALLKNTFSFSGIDGDIAELRLHCDKGRVGFAYKSDTAYAVKDNWSVCTLIMIGTPGTKFTIEEGA